MSIPPYLWVYLLFTDVTITLLVMFGIGSALQSAGIVHQRRRKILRSAALLLFGWMALDMILGWLGVFEARPGRTFPFIALAIGIPVALGIWMIRRSETVREVLHAVPQQWIIGVQAYRGIGSLFLILYGLGLLPRVFALPAGFGDVTVGLLALPIAAIYAGANPKRNWLAAIWNLLGLTDLVVAVGTGFLSSPSPIQLFSFAAPNVLIGAYPLVMIPVYAVPLSIVLHAASLTKLAWDNKSSRVSTEIAGSAI